MKECQVAMSKMQYHENIRNCYQERTSELNEIEILLCDKFLWTSEHQVIFNDRHSKLAELCDYHEQQMTVWCDAHAKSVGL